MEHGILSDDVDIGIFHAGLNAMWVSFVPPVMGFCIGELCSELALYRVFLHLK